MGGVSAVLAAAPFIAGGQYLIPQVPSKFKEVLIAKKGDVPVTVPASNDVTVNIVPTQPGEYTIICTIFCGTGHGDMHGILEVLS